MRRASSAQLIGLVNANRKSFVLPFAVADEIDPLLTRLHDELGPDALHEILDHAGRQELPEAA
jgi:hypothetical protein